MSEAVELALLGLVFAASGAFFWVFGARLFSLQSRAVLGRETEYTKRTLRSRWGRFSVAQLPALLWWTASGVALVAALMEALAA